MLDIPAETGTPNIVVQSVETIKVHAWPRPELSTHFKSLRNAAAFHTLITI
jgi:hypothetical protein